MNKKNNGNHKDKAPRQKNSTKTRSYTQSDIKVIVAESGGYCAFPDCDEFLLVDQTGKDNQVFIGKIAHIIGHSRTGPRGDFNVPEDQLDDPKNLVVLCGTHHDIVDTQPNHYSVPVLIQMKNDHKVRIKSRNMKHKNVAPVLVEEMVHSTLLPVTHLPAAIYSSPCRFSTSQEWEIKQAIVWPGDDTELVPFLLLDHRLFAFHNLHNKDNPFRAVIDPRDITVHKAADLWQTADGMRLYKNLLNRALFKYTTKLRIQYDPLHKRFFFPPMPDGTQRSITYQPLQKSKSTRKVAYPPLNKSTGQPRNYWLHLACRLQFKQVANQEWCLSVRPERHLSKDGKEPLAPKLVGRRVTRMKARVYNDLYLGEVHLWKQVLSEGRSAIILRFRDQSAVINTTLLTFLLEWPGIPGDDKPYTNQAQEDELFTLEVERAIGGESLEDGDFEDEDE